MIEKEIDFRLGDYQNALSSVECDALITDPPYSKRTHKGQRVTGKDPRYTFDQTETLAARGLPYKMWDEEDIKRLVDFWTDRCRGWCCVMTSHDLFHVYADYFTAAGRYVFAPVPCIQKNMNVRLSGDGPANWTVYMVVARPKGFKNGALPGAYIGKCHDAGENVLDRSKRIVPGGKPLWMMQQIIRDYSEPGDIICDPCAGGATTLIAAATQKRKAVGCERNEETYEKAKTRIEAGFTQDMFAA